MKDEFTTGAMVSLGEWNKGDWQSQRKNFPATLDEFHEYSIERGGSDLVYRLDGTGVFIGFRADEKEKS